MGRGLSNSPKVEFWEAPMVLAPRSLQSMWLAPVRYRDAGEGYKMSISLELRINGQRLADTLEEPRTTLLDFLREH
jgi:hypothetical protein